METITIASSRGLSLADIGMLCGSTVVIAVMAWVVLSKLKHLRNRHQEPSEATQRFS
ncbi:MAG TPA: hypothetical protein VJQ47_07080 [Steroidobacteraceae bacterium]|nr:hypothetical protein [Steroidobacteraceae bacterium]